MRDGFENVGAIKEPLAQSGEFVSYVVLSVKSAGER